MVRPGLRQIPNQMRGRYFTRDLDGFRQSVLRCAGGWKRCRLAGGTPSITVRWRGAGWVNAPRFPPTRASVTAHPTLRNFMANIHLIGGEKGGVGKSLVSRLLAQYFIDHS